MLTNLQHAERLFETAKRLRDEHRKYERLQSRGRDIAPGKPQQKHSNDLNYQAHHIVKIEAELHAVAVDAGLADLREHEHYAERIWRPTGWHEYLWRPAQPEALQAAPCADEDADSQCARCNCWKQTRAMCG